MFSNTSSASHRTSSTDKTLFRGSFSWVVFCRFHRARVSHRSPPFPPIIHVSTAPLHPTPNSFLPPPTRSHLNHRIFFSSKDAAMVPGNPIRQTGAEGRRTGVERRGQSGSM
uniref:Uncharacterized protein n=1 Tax=Knipowitschia caucasica TaxID=637954 RepID=A0AAV2LH74_KNICA